MSRACARHILVDSEEKCLQLKAEIVVPEFDAVVFSAEVGAVQGPVKTQFGYHLLEVTSRR